MEVFKFFVCLLIAKRASAGDLAALRAPETSKTTEDVLGVLAGLSGSEDVFSQFREGYNHEKIELKVEPVYSPFLDAYIPLEDMSSMFMYRSAVYLAQILREYFGLAAELTAKRAFKEVDERRKRDAVRLHDEPEYCVLTALYDWGDLDRDKYKADWLFESFAFLRTVDPDAKGRLGDLESQLQTYARRYDDVLQTRKAPRRRERFAPRTTGFDGYSAALRVMAKTMADFSRAFCSGWTSFVNGDILHLQPAAETDRSAFVRHTLRHETCEITFGQRPTTNIDPVHTEIQKNQITTWNCITILDSPEYRHHIYIGDSAEHRDEINNGDVAPKEKKHLIAKQGSSGFRQYLKSKLTRQPSDPSNSPTAARDASVSKAAGKSFTVDALKHLLRSNTYYRNAVTYHNVVANVLLLVSIREGNKLLKGIKTVVLKAAAKSDSFEWGVREMGEMRTALTAFYTVFDELVWLVWSKRRINVADCAPKITFDGRVKAVVAMMDVRPGDGTTEDQYNRILAEIPKILRGIQVDEKVVDHPLRFESYYFTEPVQNVRELYAFGENGF